MNFYLMIRLCKDLNHRNYIKKIKNQIIIFFEKKSKILCFNLNFFQILFKLNIFLKVKMKKLLI